MIVTGTITIPKSPSPWTTEYFKASTAVDMPPGYRRCNHISNGFRCPNTYDNNKYQFCFDHRGNPGEYKPEPTLSDLVVNALNEHKRLNLRELRKLIDGTPRQVRAAAAYSVDKGYIRRVGIAVYERL